MCISDRLSAVLYGSVRTGAGGGDGCLQNIHRFGEMGVRDGDRREEAHDVAVNAAGQQDQTALFSLDPVSYTHLDVYKRQPPWIAP